MCSVKVGEPHYPAAGCAIGATWPRLANDVTIPSAARIAATEKVAGSGQEMPSNASNE